MYTCTLGQPYFSLMGSSPETVRSLDPNTKQSNIYRPTISDLFNYNSLLNICLRTVNITLLLLCAARCKSQSKSSDRRTTHNPTVLNIQMCF